MKLLVLVLILSMSSLTLAYETAIYDIWPAERAGENSLVLTTDGRVLEVANNDTYLIERLNAAKNAKLLVEITVLEDEMTKEVLGQRGVISDVLLYSKVYTRPEMIEEEVTAEVIAEEHNDTKILASMGQARSYFSSMRRNMRDRSQCYNRALVWAYELSKNYGVSTSKNWMFFTRRYIREYRYHWWFHVTPIIYVSGYGVVALDRKFTNAPTPIVPWKNIFMRNNATCPLITRYSAYRENQESAHCYWIRTNMYFWQPYHIENLERGAAPRWGWKQNELNIAYGDT